VVSTSGRQKPTLRTVADAAKASTSTVSRVYSHPHRLKPTTVERVRAIASELGYVPHATAQALSTGRLSTIAVVVPDIANSFFPPLIRSAQDSAQARGFSTLLGNTDENTDKELDLLTKLEQRTDGIVLVSSRLSDEIIRSRTDHPLVLVNRDVEDVPRALLDSAPGMREAVHHLHDLQHRHIAYVGGPTNSWSDEERRRTITHETAALGMTVSMLGAHRPDHEEGREAAREVLAVGATAVIAFDDTIAQGVLARMAELQIDVPGQMSIVGCDDILASRTHPPLTTVHGQSIEVGRLAVDMLLGIIEHGTDQEDHAHDNCQSLESTLVVRGSTGPAPPTG